MISRACRRCRLRLAYQRAAGLASRNGRQRKRLLLQRNLVGDAGIEPATR